MPAAEFEVRVMEFKNLLVTREESPFRLTASAETAAVLGNAKDAKAAGMPVVKIDLPRYPKNSAGVNVRTTIEIDPINQSHATLRFTIVDRDGSRGRYYPIGLSLTRADLTEPIGTPITTDGKPLEWGPPVPNPISHVHELQGSPFIRLKLNDPFGTFEFDVVRMKVKSKIKGSERRSHTTYRLAIFFQELETGAIGLIDPEVENPY